MANVMYSGTEFSSKDVLVETSLYETLYRLQEAYYGLRPCTLAQIRDALDWVESRRDPHSRRLVFQRTDYDRQVTGGYRTASGERVKVRYIKLPTGEGTWNSAVQYIRLLLNWEEPSTEIVQQARASFLEAYPFPHAAPGRFCCARCNAVYQPTLRLVDPKRYAAQEPAFIKTLRHDRAEGHRWKQHPFYYTILALDEIGTDAARRELGDVARHIRPSLLKRYQGKGDRPSRFRRLAIETALKYA
jgi:hypothetical protein